MLSAYFFSANPVVECIAIIHADHRSQGYALKACPEVWNGPNRDWRRRMQLIPTHNLTDHIHVYFVKVCTVGCNSIPRSMLQTRVTSGFSQEGLKCFPSFETFHTVRILFASKPHNSKMIPAKLTNTTKTNQRQQKQTPAYLCSHRT